MDFLLGNSSSSSSSGEDALAEEYVRVRRHVPRTNNFIATVVDNCSNKQFQEHFRMTRGNFQELINRLAPSLERQEGSGGRLRISVDKQLLSVLWLLATPDSYRSVACRFDMGKSSLFTCFHRVIIALNEISPIVIKWPNNIEKQAIQESFHRIAGFPGVIGAVDGLYVPIKAPHENPEVYINRKCFHGITLQAIATPRLKFIDCFTGYPSSVSDIRIFRNSDIYRDIIHNHMNYFQPNEHIIGDKAYPTLHWCIPPYIDRGNLTQRQRNFNTIHAKTRQVVERAFGLLFGRFRRLRYLDMNRTDLIPSTIIAVCTLHNLCLSDDNLIEDYVNEGLQGVENEEIEVIEHIQGVDEGFAKRDYLATIF